MCSDDSDAVVVRKAQRRIQFTYTSKLSPFILLPLPHPITFYTFILTLTPVSQKVDRLEPFLHFAMLVLDHVRGIRLSKEVWGSTILDCQ